MPTVCKQGVSMKVPGTWNKPKLKGLRMRLVGRWEGVRAHDLFGPAGGYRQPGWAMSVGPGLTYANGKDVLMIDVPIVFSRYINASRSAVPGPIKWQHTSAISTQNAILG
jgi:hypothetical protein